VKEAEYVRDRSRRLAAAFDGSRQKEASLNGIVTATSHKAEKMVDVECLTVYCKGYQIHTGKDQRLVNFE
jgi:hypothetical protein